MKFKNKKAKINPESKDKTRVEVRARKDKDKVEVRARKDKDKVEVRARTLEARDHAATLCASISSIDKGKESYEGICMIRIKSRDYTLMIMDEHTPIVGEVNGDIAFLFADDEYVLQGVQGFYSLKENHFHLLMKTSRRA